MMTNTGLKPLAKEPFSITQISVLKRRPRITAAVIAATDTFCLILSCILSFFGSLQLAGHIFSLDLWLRSLPVVAITILVLGAAGLYPALGMGLLEETKQVVMCVSFVQLGSICSYWATRSMTDQAQSLGFWALSVVTVPLGRWFVRGILSRKHWWGEAVILIGSGGPLGDIFNLLTRHPRFGLYPIGVLSEAGGVPACAASMPVLHSLETGITFAQQHKIYTAVVVQGSAGGSSVSDATSRYAGCFPKLVVVPGLSPELNICSNTGTLGGYRSIQVSQRLLMPFWRAVKRSIDLVIAVSAFIALLPLMVLVAAAVKLTSPGPIFFTHRRIGQDGVPFRAWKFRTMVSDADTLFAERLASNPALRLEWERDHKLRSDPRLTPIGPLLRKSSLDELPQLWNVLRSEMSIVGPRPIISAEIPRYAGYFAEYSRVLPGITGLWQVSGRNETTYDERVQLDTFYVNNWSLWLDLYIIAKTFHAVFGARGAY
jgi:Undecaprenyl-phosphate galactose phosphotransferase WbaP